MLIADDLLLLLYDDTTGKQQVDGSRLVPALAGALLLELAMRGAVDIADGSGEVKSGRLVVVDPQPLGDPVLDEALQRISSTDGRKKPGQLLGPMGKGLRDRLLRRLAERGILRASEGKILGLFPTTRWPAVDSAHEAQVRRRLHDVLVVGASPDDRTAALTALLLAIDAVPKVVASDDRKALKRRAKDMAESPWAAEAVRKSVEATNAAVMAGIVAATAAGAAASSS